MKLVQGGLGMRIVCLAALLAPAAVGQGTAGSAALTALEQDVQKTSSAWQVLARDMDARVARMLPCDPRAKTAIDETSRASQARLTALAEYYRTAQALAATRAEGARRLLASGEALSAALADDQTAAAQAAVEVERQLAALTESAKQQAVLAQARTALEQSAQTVQQRTALAKNAVDRRPSLIAALQDLVAAYASREAALKERLDTFENERTRWNGYYAARLARSQTECSVTNPSGGVALRAPVAAPRPPQPVPQATPQTAAPKGNAK